MKRIFFIFLAILFQSSAIFAQQLTQTIKGIVIDRDSKTPLIGASVFIKLDTISFLGSSTDVNGNFRIEKVPIGRHTIKASYIGYENLTIPEILVGSGKELELTIELTQSVSQLNEIVISGNPDKGKPINEMSTVSARSFNVDEATRYAGNINGDVARIAQSYAGVSGSNLGNEIVIRGNSPKGLLWRLEGIEIPNLNHLAETGSSGGGLSILSVNVLKNSDFYTGAFPAEYGNALSGVFDVRLRNGNNEKREYAIQAGFMGLEAAAEGPFSKKTPSSYLANYRYSTIGIFDALGLRVTENVIAPKFHDLTFKLNFPTEKKGTFTLFGIGGISAIKVPATKDSIKWEINQNRFEISNLSNMFATGIIHKYFFGEKNYLTSYLSFSGNQIGNNTDSLDNQYNFHPTIRNSFSETAIRISTAVNHKFNAKNTLRTGIIYSNIAFNLLSENKSKQITYVDNNGSSGLVQFYSQWKHRFNDKLTLNTGFHSSYFALNTNFSVEPRLSLQWNFSALQSISIGTGLHSRIEPLTFYFAQVRQNPTYTTPNKNLQPTKALHYVISYDNQLAENLRLKIEAYYQYLYDVPVENKSDSGFSVLNYSGSWASRIDNNANVPFINKGTGTNYGVEITLEKFFSKNYYFLFTASLYDSKYKALDEIERNTRFNNNYITNLIAGKEFNVGKNKTNAIVTDIKLVWSGGNPLTPIDFDKSRAQGTTVYELDKRYSEKAPAYFKIDYKIGYRKNNKKSSHYIFLDIQNLTNQKNIYSQYYDPVPDKIVTFYQLGIIPIFNYRVQF